ncbi:MAG: diguanylate cyclase response regulator [Candidatus Scalindua sp.]|nr:diguanylate cyclase response regulator [Candidatus Scalindua sp.]
MKVECIRVLLIEDSYDSAEILREELMDTHPNVFELEHADRLSNGLEVLGKGDTDVVLLDISLPDSQGLETFARVYKHSPDVPILVMTNLDDESFAVKAVQEGAQDYIVKGRVDRSLLVRSIRYAIERHRTLKELKQAQLKMQHMAHHDRLTGLPNRQLFLDILSKSVARASRDGRMVAVLFLDLDGFKSVNDNLGHLMGDLLLQSVAGRLKGCIRESDLVARVGGDEFVIIIDGIHSVKNVTKVSQKIVDETSRSFFLDGQELFVTASIGISLYPHDSSDMETLVKNADFAMYIAKRQGKNNYHYYLSELNEKDTKEKKANLRSVCNGKKKRESKCAKKEKFNDS